MICMESGFEIELKFIWAIVFKTRFLSLFNESQLSSRQFTLSKHFLHSYHLTTIAEYLGNMTSNKSLYLRRCICPLDSLHCRVDKYFLHSYYSCDSITITRGLWPTSQATTTSLHLYHIDSIGQPLCTGRNSKAKGSFCSSKSFYLKQKWWIKKDKICL